MSLAEVLPKTLTKEPGALEGWGQVKIRINVPATAEPGEYTVPVTVKAEAVGAKLETQGYITFRIMQPPSAPSGIAPDAMTYLLAALLIGLVATAYLKGHGSAGG